MPAIETTQFLALLRISLSVEIGYVLRMPYHILMLRGCPGLHLSGSASKLFHSFFAAVRFYDLIFCLKKKWVLQVLTAVTFCCRDSPYLIEPLGSWNLFITIQKNARKFDRFFKFLSISMLRRYFHLIGSPAF